MGKNYQRAHRLRAYETGTTTKPNILVSPFEMKQLFSS